MLVFFLIYIYTYMCLSECNNHTHHSHAPWLDHLHILLVSTPHAQQAPTSALQRPRSFSHSKALRKSLNCSSTTPTLAHAHLLVLWRSDSPPSKPCQECRSALWARCRTSLSFLYRSKGCSFLSTTSSTLRSGTGRRFRRPIRCSRKRLVETSGLVSHSLRDCAHI